MTQDTSEIIESPAGSDDVTSSPDTDSQVTTQPAESGEVLDGETPKEAEKALLAGKYKSPEDLEKGYKELESKLGELGQKATVAEMIQNKYGLTPEQFQAQVEAQEREAQRQRYANDPLAPIYDKVAEQDRFIQQMQAEKALQAEEKELDKFLKENPDYEPFRDKILNLGLNLEKDKSYADIANEYFGQSRAQGQQDAYKKIDSKIKTQSTTSTGSPKREITIADMENMPIEDLRSYLGAK